MVAAACARARQAIDKHDPKRTAMTSAHQSDAPRTPFLWTRGVGARETLSYLDRHGIAAEPLLLKAELSRDARERISGLPRRARVME